MNDLIVIEQTATGYSAYSPDLPGCIATGRTRDDVEREMKDAIAFRLDGLRAEGVAIPKPNTSRSDVEMSRVGFSRPFQGSRAPDESPSSTRYPAELLKVDLTSVGPRGCIKYWRHAKGVTPSNQQLGGAKPAQPRHGSPPRCQWRSLPERISGRSASKASGVSPQQHADHSSPVPASRSSSDETAQESRASPKAWSR